MCLHSRHLRHFDSLTYRVVSGQEYADSASAYHCRKEPMKTFYLTVVVPTAQLVHNVRQPGLGKLSYEFVPSDCESLDRPDLIPAGSVVSNIHYERNIALSFTSIGD